MAWGINFTKLRLTQENSFQVITWGLVVALVFLLNPNINQELFLAINKLSNTYLPPWLIAHITDLGNGTVAISILLIASHRNPEYAVRILILIIITSLIANFTKQYYNLPRPVLVLVATDFTVLDNTVTTDSLPSGHALTVFAIAGLVWFSKLKPYLKNLVVLLAVIAGLSRIAVGVHWPQDIALGALIGWLSAYLACRATNPEATNRTLGRVLIIIIGLLLVCAEFFIDLPLKEFPETSSIYVVRKLLVGLSLVVVIHQIFKVFKVPTIQNVK